MKPFTFLLFAIFVSGLFASEPKVVPLWPGAAPGSESRSYEEQETVGPQDGIQRIHNVTRPTLTIYLPDPSIGTGTAVIVCVPEGDFVTSLSIMKEPRLPNGSIRLALQRSC
jgi:hypothetical protein